jgi:hypothetical protein
MTQPLVRTLLMLPRERTVRLRWTTNVHKDSRNESKHPSNGVER